MATLSRLLFSLARTVGVPTHRKAPEEGSAQAGMGRLTSTYLQLASDFGLTDPNISEVPRLWVS